MMAPGAMSFSASLRAVATRNANRNSAALMTTVATRRPILNGTPNEPTLLAHNVDSAVVPSTPTPPIPSRIRLRTRDFSGFGRSLRGTCHAVFIAYWLADDPDDEPAGAATYVLWVLELRADDRELAQSGVDDPVL